MASRQNLEFLNKDRNRSHHKKSYELVLHMWSYENPSIETKGPAVP